MDTDPHDGLNGLQRRYFAWAAPHYARMPQSMRHEVECLDRWLYSRAGVRLWLAMAAVVLLGIVGLRALGMSWTFAVPGAFVVCAVVVVGTLAAWLRPQRYTPARLARHAASGIVLAYLGAILGIVATQVVKTGPLDPAVLPDVVGTALRKGTPALLLMLATIGLLLWSVAAVRRFRMQREMDALRTAQERDAIARQLAEARLRLLQGQIQPHFIFNTLAAVQHWVDQGDARAGPLLRALTAFLRGSTALLAQEQTTFAVELETVRHYLSVMEMRFGDRLRHAIAVDPGAAGRCVPPGLLLTLVENAIEHGLSPALHGGTLSIEAVDDAAAWTLCVRDDGVGLADGWSEGVGLRNGIDRLAHRFGERASLTLRPLERGVEATVRIAHDAFA